MNLKTKYKYCKERQAIAREAFGKFVGEEESRNLLYDVLDVIQEKTHSEGQESVWCFYPEDLSKEIPEINLEKINNTLQFLFDVKWIRNRHPSLNKPEGTQKFIALPHKFSPSKVEDTKRRYEILACQKALHEYIQKNIPNNNVVLDKKQIEEAKFLLLYLKERHTGSTAKRTWEEPVVAYFMLKSKLKRNPRQYEVSEILGLTDYKYFTSREELREAIKKRGFELKFSYFENLNSEKRSKRVKGAYEEIQKQGIIPTVLRITKRTGYSPCNVRKYVNKLKLKVVSSNEVSHIENVQKVKIAYKKLENELPPTTREIAEETNLSKSYIQDICKEQDLKTLPDNQIGLRIVYRHLKDLMEIGVDIPEITNLVLQDYMNNMGDYFSHNPITRWRKILDAMKLMPLSKRMKEKQQPLKHLKYQESYLKLVKTKMKNKEKIVLKRIAEELSEEFHEEVPEHRISELRNATGIPVLLDNEARYRNIVKIYEKHPEMQMEDWSEEARVSMGFLYDALRQFKKLPQLRKKFEVPDEMLGRLKTRENPMIKAFRAIGNTNRIKIIKCLIEQNDIPLDEILEKIEYDPAKWRDTFEYHLEVLEDAGIVSLSYYNNKINLTSLGEDISSHIKAWDIDEIVPEEIFGPGFNKPLFALAISGGDIKALKEIVKFMREVKGHTPIDVPSAKARERYPVHKYWGRKFKKYLNNFLGKYQIKEEHLQFLGPLILNVRDFFSTSHISIPHLCKIKDVDYNRVRNITFALVDRGSVDEFYLQVPQEQALKYMNFIKDNFYAICERMKLQVPQKNVKLEQDRHNEIYSLKLY